MRPWSKAWSLLGYCGAVGFLSRSRFLPDCPSGAAAGRDPRTAQPLSSSLEKTQQQLSESQAEIRQLRAKIDVMESRQGMRWTRTPRHAVPAVTQET